jgi:endonuclease/exonuclease/phosphatase family metal-dependent hydrolase
MNLSKNIKLLTYNIIHFPTFPPFTKKTFYKPERLKVLAEKLKPFDVVCLQEMYRPLSENLDAFLANLRLSGFKYFYIIDLNGHFTHFLSDGGVMIVSKHKILYAEQRQWTFGIKQDAVCNKGGIYCQLELPGKKTMHLINVHVQATYSFDPDEKQTDTVIVRQQQFSELKCWMKDLFRRFKITRDQIFMLCGDFNMNANHMTKSIQSYFKSVEVEDETRKIDQLTNLRNSSSLYSFFMNFMGYDNDLFSLIDVYKTHHNQFPITFGSVEYDEDNNPVQQETYLTDEKEFFVTETLDYIFLVKPSPSYSSSIDDQTGKEIIIWVK